jgi:hypothetical protein
MRRAAIESISRVMPLNNILMPSSRGDEAFGKQLLVGQQCGVPRYLQQAGYVACRGNPLTRRQSPSEDLADQRTVDLLMQSSDSVELHNGWILSQRDRSP